MLTVDSIELSALLDGITVKKMKSIMEFLDGKELDFSSLISSVYYKKLIDKFNIPQLVSIC